MIAVIGLDLAKNVFQVHGVDEHGKTVLSKKLARAKVLTFFANQPPCLVGMEACGGSHFWAREIAKFGHNVKQMPPQFVKPYVKTNKTDARDAEAICEAVTRPGMRFVPTKSIEQQDVLALHRIRERHVAARTAVANQARGLLLELGVVIPQGIRKLRTQLPLICEDLENSLTTIERSYLYDLYAELAEKDDKIIQYDHILANICKDSEQCRLLMSIPGIGLLGATAIVASIGDGKEFSNGRQLAAWLGLVPKQHSSGGKTRMQGISKRGDAYLRRLLIHGSRAVVKYSFKKTDGQSTWLNEVISRRGTHKAIAAQANKTARIIWAVLTKGAPFQAAA